MSFFGIILTTTVTILQIYVFFRLWSLPLLRKYISLKGFIVCAVLLWILFYLGRLFGGHEGLAEIVLEFAGMHWMGILFLVATGFFLADVITGFGFLFRGSLQYIRTAGFLLGLIAVILAHVQGIRAPVVERYDIGLKDIPQNLKSLKIAVLADIHGGEMLIGPEWINKRIDETLKLNPDLIVLAGDIFERSSNPDEMIPVMKRLKAPLGVWAVRGNHDTARHNRDVFGEIIRGAGIGFLENEWVKIKEGIIIAGIDDLTRARRNKGSGEQYIKKAMGDKPDGLTVFVSHTPWMADMISDHGADIMISGHTHNGQIWPFNYFVKIKYPFINGRYDIKGMTLIVSRGTGTWGPRMRLWKPGEITLITLHRGKL